MLEAAGRGNVVEETTGRGGQGGRWTRRARACAWGRAARPREAYAAQPHFFVFSRASGRRQPTAAPAVCTDSRSRSQPPPACGDERKTLCRILWYWLGPAGSHIYWS